MKLTISSPSFRVGSQGKRFYAGATTKSWEDVRCSNLVKVCLHLFSQLGRAASDALRAFANSKHGTAPWQSKNPASPWISCKVFWPEALLVNCWDCVPTESQALRHFFEIARVWRAGTSKGVADKFDLESKGDAAMKLCSHLNPPVEFLTISVLFSRMQTSRSMPDVPAALRATGHTTVGCTAGRGSCPEHAATRWKQWRPLLKIRKLQPSVWICKLWTFNSWPSWPQPGAMQSSSSGPNPPERPLRHSNSMTSEAGLLVLWIGARG